MERRQTMRWNCDYLFEIYLSWNIIEWYNTENPIFRIGSSHLDATENRWQTLPFFLQQIKINQNHEKAYHLPIMWHNNCKNKLCARNKCRDFNDGISVELYRQAV